MTILLTGATAATMQGGYGLIPDAAIVLDADRITWIGPSSDLPSAYRSLQPLDLQGRLVTPGLIDCHSHIVFGGNRAAEFELRLQGASYEEIARQGGGILSTVTATRAASEDDLVAAALPRLDAMIRQGTTTVEVKSGYGLTVADELKVLRAARRLAALRPVTITTTHLAAHAIPPEYRGNPDGYIDDVALPSLYAAHAEGLVDAVDSFCEGIAFTPAQLAPLYDRARALGLPVKIHAEQLSHMGGTAFACGYGALSADHLEHATQADAQAMAASGTVAVLLPGAFYALRETVLPPVAAFRAAGVPMALATDCNPGTSPLTSLLLTMNMGATLFRLTVAECLLGVTAHAAQALGLQDVTGRIAPGLSADMVLWDVQTPAQLVARIGFNPLYARIFQGEVVA